MNCFVLFIVIVTLGYLSGNVKAACEDKSGRIVRDGMHFMPAKNPCILCICHENEARWCKNVSCSPPEDCQSFTVGSQCCEFECMDNINISSANTVTIFHSFLTFILLYSFWQL